MIKYMVERPGRVDGAANKVDTIEAEDWVFDDGCLVFYRGGRPHTVYNKYEWKKLTRVG